MPPPSDDFPTRFAGLARLFGHEGLDRLRHAHVAVVGLGGVGSWTVEALARSGIGTLTLIDLDEVCLSNVNRQLPALDGTVGRFKAEVLAERVLAIHPGATVHPRVEFFTEASAHHLLEPAYDAVIDAIDAVANKCRLLAACHARSIPVFACGAAGGRLDPTRLRTTDLADASHDRLLAEVRRRLRRNHGFPPHGQPFGIPCVFSQEPPVLPHPDPTCPTATPTESPANLGPCDAPGPGGFHEESELTQPARQGLRLGCDWGYGSATFVTGAFGFAAAAWAVQQIASSQPPPPAV